MKKVQLLDCTLRDGGYVNDWNFGHSVITGTYKRLDAAGVDYIEVGFLDDRRPFDMNRTIAPDTNCYNQIFEGIEKKHAIPVAMIDYGTCSLDHIGDCNSTFIDGIRVIFKKEKIAEALPYCRAIKEKGYKLFIQAISITAYSDMEMLQYVELINEIKPYAFSIVDTYGLLDSPKLTNYFSLINHNLDPEIIMAYHAHNNFQLAFSNTIKFLGMETNRTLVADGTVYGMGKSAGNCPIELISVHMNQRYDKKYDPCQFMEILDTDLMSVYQKQYWGYRYNFYISAMQNCHPNYVQYLLDKKTLTVSAINEILESIPPEIKLLYSKEYIEKAYFEYQSHTIDDSAEISKLKQLLYGKRVVLLGPGHTLSENRQQIRDYIINNNAVVISVNFEPDIYECKYVFVSNAKRYSKLSDNMSPKSGKSQLIVTSNITPYDRKADFVLNYRSLLSDETEQSDNSLLLCLKALIKLEVKDVALAGFDGFSSTELDYYTSSYSFAGNEQYRLNTNESVAKGIKQLASKIKLKFLTDSLYEKVF